MKNKSSVYTDFLYFCFFVCITVCIYGCSKSYLDAKPNKAAALPDNLPVLQAILDNDQIFNSPWPSAGEIGSDNINITDEAWENLHTDITSRNLYVWGNDMFNESIYNEWFLLYQVVFQANVVLENIDKITLAENETEQDRRNVKGQALFFRGMAFYELAQLFAPPYDSSDAGALPGIPLKLSADINSITIKSSVADTYNQALSDLKDALELLPVKPLYLTRPSVPAAYGVLARVYLSMRQYHPAKLYADSCLQLKKDIIDYNTLNPNDYNPVPLFNSEVIFHCVQFSRSILSDPYGNVDSNLYASYALTDLRRAIFFKPNTMGHGGMCFYGSYAGSYYQFCGIATDEMLLTRAECRARESDVTGALQDLNDLLQNRYEHGSFVPYTGLNREEALDTILNERRKELVFRGRRWADLRRLNFEKGYTVIVRRLIEGTEYILPPGDNRYLLLIPDAAVKASGIAQNPR